MALTVDHQPLYRDFLIDRARYLLYRLVGTTIDDATSLAVAGGKSYWGLEANLVFRLLSTFDAREGLVKKLGNYPRDRCLSTNPVENAFSELVQVAGGYMPRLEKAIASFRKAERRALKKMSSDIEQFVSRRKRYPIARMAGRREWFDGQRQDSFWPLVEVRTEKLVAVKPKGETTHTSGARACRTAVASTREFSKNNAVKAQCGDGRKDSKQS